jgi:hypothetical protein
MAGSKGLAISELAPGANRGGSASCLDEVRKVGAGQHTDRGGSKPP